MQIWEFKKIEKPTNLKILGRRKTKGLKDATF
jgi:hypothetical protein